MGSGGPKLHTLPKEDDATIYKNEASSSVLMWGKVQDILLKQVAQ